MGLYIDGLETPKTGSIRIQLYDDGTVWAFQGFGWEHQEKKYTDLDLVRCGECEHWNVEDHWCNIRDSYGWDYKPTDYCSYGERRADEFDIERD